MISSSFVVLCWLIYLKLFAKDPGYIDSLNDSQEFNSSILKHRLEQNIENNNILDFSDFKKLFKKETKLRRINFDTPKWGMQSNEEYLGFQNQDNSQLGIIEKNFGAGNNLAY